MDCPKCSREYSEPDRLPRILTRCGHTLCQLCVSQLLNSSGVICHQCQQVTPTNTVSSLPVNIALMRLKQKDVQLDICEKHNKQMEAYCASDLELLCVSCILEDGHKRHDITSIAKAALKQRETMRNGKLSALLIDQAIRKKENDLQALETTIRQDHVATLQSLSDLFTTLQEVIRSRQHELEDRINAILTTELDKIQQSREANNTQLAAIQKLCDEVDQMESNTDISVLQKVKSRDGLLKVCSGKVTAVLGSRPFSGFSKEAELNNLWKIVKQRTAPVSAAPAKPTKTPLPLPTKTVPVAKPPPKTNNPFEVSVAKPADPSKQSSAPKKGKSGLIKLDLEQSDAGLSVDMGSELNVLQDWKGDLSPISKGGNSFDDDALSMKSVDLSTFCRPQQSSVLVFGGTSNAPISSIEKLDLMTEDWSRTGESLSFRSQFGCFAIEGKVVLIGGKVDGKRVIGSELYLPSAVRCIEHDLRLPSPRSGFALTLVNTDLYVLGGSDGVPLKSMDLWNGQSWTSAPSLRVRREELAAVLGPDLQIYALGGYGGSEM